ncbi:hypothetical protein [Egbenema bharatensis]|uniref:hypothetical protein n=1 Tax=Egbenema bharatensis TaxID=3463334 RepID=UPI003A8BB62F
MLEPRFVQPPLFSVTPSSPQPSPTLNKLSPENNLSPDSEMSDASRSPDDASQFVHESIHPSLQPARQPDPEHHSAPTSSQGSSDNRSSDNRSSDDRLDESSLNTVLDMLGVIDTVEELALLELLTDTQKRQVWDVTPEAVKTRLKQLRLSAKNAPSKTNSPVRAETAPLAASSTPDLTRSQQLSAEPELEEAEEQDLRELEELAYSEAWQEDSAIESDSYPVETGYSTHQPTLTVGDWVVLQANSRLTMAELAAIWEVVEVHPQQNMARIQTKGVGTRNYPIAWMVLYPKPKFD